MILSHLLSEGCGHQSVLRFQLSDLLLTDCNPLELVTAQTNCGEAYTEQETNGQPQSFHVVITILSISLFRLHLQVHLEILHWLQIHQLLRIQNDL